MEMCPYFRLIIPEKLMENCSSEGKLLNSLFLTFNHMTMDTMEGIC